MGSHVDVVAQHLGDDGGPGGGDSKGLKRMVNTFQLTINKVAKLRCP